MTTGAPLLKALLIYGICLPLAILIGYLLGENPLGTPSMYFTALVFLALAVPMLLRWHQALLIASWQMTMVVFLLPGRPFLWLVIALVSLGVSLLQRMLLAHMKWVPSSPVAAPLLVLAVVVVGTAMLTGGVGFRALGSETFGGRQYATLLGAIIGYFALTARPIPPNRAYLYCALYFLGSLTAVVGSVGRIVTSPAFYYFFLFFPPEVIPGAGGDDLGMIRFIGASTACVGVICFLLARYGLRGVFQLRKPWRMLLFGGMFALSMSGGFRSVLIWLVMLIGLQFYLEGLAKPKAIFGLVVVALIGSAIVIPTAHKLPYTLQRTLAFLPLNVSPVVRADAEASTQWRISMWKEVLPEVPQYLLLGKGYALSSEELAKVTAIQEGGLSHTVSMVTGEYHNGPLSVIMPLGIWGALAFLWFLWAGGRALYLNYKYGDPYLNNINTLLLAFFITQSLQFMVVFGSISVELVKFTGVVGLSVALNGGICRPVVAVVRSPQLARPVPLVLRRRQPALSKSA